MNQEHLQMIYPPTSNEALWLPSDMLVSSSSHHHHHPQSESSIVSALPPSPSYHTPADHLATYPSPAVSRYSDVFYSPALSTMPLAEALMEPIAVGDLAEGMSTLQVQDSHRLSLDIQPCISVTEPTPIKPRPDLWMVDQFINQHSAHLEMLTPQQDWLSWTPKRGSSPDLLYDTSSVHSDSYFDVSFIDFQAPALTVSSEATGVSFSTGTLTPPAATTTATRRRRVSEPPQFTDAHNNSRSNSIAPMKMRRSTSDRRSQGSFTCQHPGCGKSFTRAYNLTSHMRTHTSERPFPCGQCGRRFARQHDRSRHEKLHLGIKPFTCVQCNKSFARMDALNRHLRVENGCGSAASSQQ